MFWNIFLHKRAILISFRQFCNNSVIPLQFVAVSDIRKGKTGEVCPSLLIRSFTSQVSQGSVAVQQMGSYSCVRNQEGLRVRKRGNLTRKRIRPSQKRWREEVKCNDSLELFNHVHFILQNTHIRRQKNWIADCISCVHVVIRGFV